MYGYRMIASNINNKEFILKKIISVLALLTLVTACSPEVGSKDWCADLKEKPKGEWTLDETKNYAKHCIFSSDEE